MSAQWHICQAAFQVGCVVCLTSCLPASYTISVGKASMACHVGRYLARTRRSLPVQAMMYRTLLSGLAEACSSGLASGLFTMHMLDPKRDLSRQVSSCLAPQRIMLY